MKNELKNSRKYPRILIKKMEPRKFHPSKIGAPKVISSHDSSLLKLAHLPGLNWFPSVARIIGSTLDSMEKK